MSYRLAYSISGGTPETGSQAIPVQKNRVWPDCQVRPATLPSPMTVEGQLGSTQNNAKKGLKNCEDHPIKEEVKRPRTEDMQVLAVVAGYRKRQI